LLKIENELGNQRVGDPPNKIPNVGEGQYMELLEVSRDNRINIAPSFNNPNMNAGSWSMNFAPGA
jgi:hypothetical protein